ncbi:Rho-related GTP-binding protein [Vairimorpha necatrix]|uniref:Rho-related GTP-binding protein n=1 Tax=Vairimorpha necatrix TaxID=6039 RepID=A0AAX4JCI5_9MICR
MRTIKLVFVGDNSVGKTWLIRTYLSNETPSGYVSTIFDNFGTRIQYKEEYYMLSIHDTAGVSEWSKTNTLSHQQTDVFIVCFSVDDTDTFNNAVKFVDKLRRYDVPIILCATKADLRDSRVVDASVSNHSAARLGCYDYIETSSVDFKNVRRVFDTACEAAIEPKDYGTSKCCGIFYCC